MATMGILANAATSSSASSDMAPPPALTSQDFMQILVAEFQNQDPTTPVDPTQFASQLVEFSNLGQLQSINQAVTPTGAESLQSAAAYIGRQVVAVGNGIGVKGGKATSIVYAPLTTDTYTATVSDSKGNPVDQVSLGQLQGGALQTFTWDPSSSMNDGAYSVQIVDSKGNPLSGLLEQGVVSDVSLTPSATGAAPTVNLDLGNLNVTENAVHRVAQP